MTIYEKFILMGNILKTNCRATQILGTHAANTKLVTPKYTIRISETFPTYDGEKCTKNSIVVTHNNSNKSENVTGCFSRIVSRMVQHKLTQHTKSK